MVRFSDFFSTSLGEVEVRFSCEVWRESILKKHLIWKLICMGKSKKKFLKNTDQWSRSVFFFTFWAKSPPKCYRTSLKKIWLDSLIFSLHPWGRLRLGCLVKFGDNEFWKNTRSENFVNFFDSKFKKFTLGLKKIFNFIQNTLVSAFLPKWLPSDPLPSLLGP